MSLLVEIANRADVPLESVVRVLTREPVNDDHKGRILSVLDSLGAEETRVLQRFALAAVHDAVPRPGGAPAGEAVDHEAVIAELVDDPLLLPEAVRLEPGPGTELVPAPVEDAVEEEHLPAAVDPAPLVQLGSVLEELTDAVRDLRRETDAERRERVDDLAVLIDLITKGWEGVDRRLGRVERKLGRLESAGGLPPPTVLPAAAAIEPPPVPAPPGPPTPDHPGPEPVPEPEPPPERSTLRRRLPLIAALAFGIAIGAIAALDLPTRLDASGVVESPTQERAPTPQLEPPLPLPTSTSTGSVLGTTETERPAATTARGTTTGSARPRPAPSRSSPLNTTGAATTTAARPATTAPARPAPPRTTTTARTTTQARTTQPRTTTQRQAPATAPSFTPSRNWAWPPAQGADYYLVEFFRGGQMFYSARPTEPRLTLPEEIRFTPGVYRWRVRPGRGAPSENRLDPPIVDSEFILPR
jgi:hypothetical protein